LSAFRLSSRNSHSMPAMHMAGMFPAADMDVLITAAIFHDFGKIREYERPLCEHPGYLRCGCDRGVIKTWYRNLVRHVAGSHAEFVMRIAGKGLPEEVVLKS